MSTSKGYGYCDFEAELYDFIPGHNDLRGPEFYLDSAVNHILSVMWETPCQKCQKVLWLLIEPGIEVSCFEWKLR